MKRYGVFAVAVLTLLGMLAPPALAAEAPKVDISVFMDFVAAYSKNAQSHKDDDFTDTERAFYSRERGVFTITGSLGKAKAVYSLEQDITNGTLASGSLNATKGIGAGLGTDVSGAGLGKGTIETKWLYLEFPFTGPGSLLPMIEQPTTARAGLQPFSGHDFKRVLAVDQFAGVNFSTAVTPDVKNTFTYVQDEEDMIDPDPVDPTGVTPISSAWAILESVEFSPQKGLTVKPTFAYAEDEIVEVGGIDFNKVQLWWLGVDAEWREGPWMIEPTFFYNGGELKTGIPGLPDGDVSAWIFDILGSWRSGPLKIGGRFAYTPGNSAEDLAAVGLGAAPDVDFYIPIFNSGTYYAGWSEVFTTGYDYNFQSFTGNGGTIGTVIEHPSGFPINYGRIGATVKADYSVTPAAVVTGLVHFIATAEDVDNNGDFIGDESYIGTEISVHFNYAFAPRVKFSAAYSHLFAGSALDNCPGGAAAGSCLPAEVADAEDVDLLVTRVRFSF